MKVSLFYLIDPQTSVKNLWCSLHYRQVYTTSHGLMLPSQTSWGSSANSSLLIFIIENRCITFCFDMHNLCPSSLWWSAYLHDTLYIPGACESLSSWLPWSKVLIHRRDDSSCLQLKTTIPVLLISDYQGCEDVFQKVWLLKSLVFTCWLNEWFFLLFKQLNCSCPGSAGSQDGWATGGPHAEQDDPGLWAVSLQYDASISLQ